MFVFSCTWSPDSQKIAGSTISGEVHIWDVESGRELVKYNYHKKVKNTIRNNPLLLYSLIIDSSQLLLLLLLLGIILY